MSKEPTFKELLDYINGGADEAKANCSLGLFISDYYEENVKEVDNFVVKKPIVNISSFVDENELFYNVSFYFKSYDDIDFKQMWKFICRYANKVRVERQQLDAGKELEKVSGLSVSIIPEIYQGKYFAYINIPFVETMSCTENAFDKTAVISFICNEESFGILSSDDDLIDRRSIEREVEQEILSEMEDEDNRM